VKASSRDSASPQRWKDHLEQELAGIWEEVLGQPVGATDDFFVNLGGDSLTAFRLSFRIQERLRIPLSPATFLESRTVARLADRLRRRDYRGSTLVAIQPQGRYPPLFFSHGADGSVFYYRRLAEHLAPDLPFYGIQAPSTGQAPASLAEMAAGYIADIKILRPRGPYFLGGYCMGGTVALEMARQLQSAGEQVSLLVLIDTYDWTRCAPGSRSERLAFLAQKLRFHGGNVLLLPFPKRRVFLREKVRWGVGLLSVWWNRKDAQTPASSVFRLLSENAPEFYPGHITCFKSRVVYNRYRGHELMAGAHAASVETEELPVYPGGILMEPFVSCLAEQIKDRLSSCLGLNGDKTAQAAPE
jgi:pimeloyl-ACP methyl ester carboxylesterase